MYSAQYKLVVPTHLPKQQTSTSMTLALLPLVAVCSVQTEDSSTAPYINHAGVAKHTVIPCHTNNILSVSPVLSVRENLLKKLNQFRTQLNKPGWAGYDSLPIERDSYINACKLVMHTPDNILALWDVFPSPNGTISLEFKDKEIAVMSIGNMEFSYVAISKDRKKLKDKLAFDASKASNALIAVSELLGYKS